MFLRLEIYESYEYVSVTIYPNKEYGEMTVGAAEYLCGLLTQELPDDSGVLKNVIE